MCLEIPEVLTSITKSSATCYCCGKKSRPVEIDDDGEPDLLSLPSGWSQAPFPADYRHADGSFGSQYTCPACNKRLERGEVIKMQNGLSCRLWM